MAPIRDKFCSSGGLLSLAIYPLLFISFLESSDFLFLLTSVPLDIYCRDNSLHLKPSPRSHFFTSLITTTFERLRIQFSFED